MSRFLRSHGAARTGGVGDVSGASDFSRFERLTLARRGPTLATLVRPRSEDLGGGGGRSSLRRTDVAQNRRVAIRVARTAQPTRRAAWAPAWVPRGLVSGSELRRGRAMPARGAGAAVRTVRETRTHAGLRRAPRAGRATRTGTRVERGENPPHKISHRGIGVEEGQWCGAP
jgi:hypothetical protein